MASTTLLFLLIGVFSGAVVLCASVPSSIKIGTVFSERILGGDEASAGVYPYAVSLRVDNTHVCGGNIISENYMLTTAHCVLNKDLKPYESQRLSARVGSTNQYAGGQVVQINDITIHPNYYKLQNNLAILKFAKALVLSDRIKAIVIASSEADLPVTDAAVSVAGWGITTDGSPSFKIRQLSLKKASDENCKIAYSAHDDSSLCLAHDLKEGTCNGDGGSGAKFNDKLIGLVNFVVGTCGSRYPDVFVNVAHYASWIAGVTNIKL